MEALMNRIPKAVYTKEFREEAVKLALTEGVGVSEAARRLSIPMKSLANWVRAAKAGMLLPEGQKLPGFATLIRALNTQTHSPLIFLGYGCAGETVTGYSRG